MAPSDEAGKASAPPYPELMNITQALRSICCLIALAADEPTDVRKYVRQADGCINRLWQLLREM